MRKIIIAISALTLITIGSITYLIISKTNSYIKQGNILVEKVEEYKQQYNKLPKTITDLNIKESMGTGPYYELIDSTKYIVYFNIGFDNTFIYSPNTKEWIETP
ncbi:MAG: hypothetical protein N4A72_01095 [Bacteroidales bacterium]|jgi:hypothetical protein|nr:hypothetical protein [Bacteroidales bacterium]